MAPPNSLIRPAREADIDKILALERSVPEAPHWPRTEYARIVASVGSNDTLHQRLFIIEIDGRFSGFAAGKALSGGEGELESVVVQPSARGIGAGLGLVRAVIEWCRGLNISRILLEVRASNIAAIGLYGSLGFVNEGRRKHYYQDPKEDAVMMCLDLKNCG